MKKGENNPIFYPFIPKDLTLEITKKCPLNCVMCSSNGGDQYPAELSVLELKRIIDQAKSLGTQTIIFSGGEPFEHSGLIDLCTYVKHRGMNVCIYTSGNIIGSNFSKNPIDDEIMSSLKKANTTNLIFGLHGPNEIIHDSITGVKGSFSNTLNSIESAIKNQISTEIHFVPLKMNYETIPEMIEVARKKKVETFSVLRFVAQGRGKINANILSLDTREQMDLESLLVKCVTSKNPVVRIGTPFNVFGISQGNYCTAGRTRATIRADGFVFPCEAMKEMVGSDDNYLRKNSLRKIWESSYLFQKSRNYTFALNDPLCKTCSKYFQCKGGCPAQQLQGTSLSKTRDPYCRVIEVSQK